MNAKDGGWGCITCPRMWATAWTTDVWISPDVASGLDLQNGTPCQFDAYWWKDRVHGRNLKIVPEGSKQSGKDGAESSQQEEGRQEEIAQAAEGQERHSHWKIESIG